MRLLPILLASLILLLPAVTHAATWHVPSQCPTIQAGIDSASAGDVVELADAIYTGEGNRDIDFMSKAVTVRSASGNPDLCVIDCEGSESAPHRAFRFHSGEGPESVLEGVSIVQGWRDPGAAIRCEDSSPTLTNCIFRNNAAGYGDGGGLYCITSSPTLTNCVFRSNRAVVGSGGGLCCIDSSPEITGCTFQENGASFGGGISCNGLSSPVITECDFVDNVGLGDAPPSLSMGAGLASSGNSSPTLLECTFVGNSADEGGAICLSGCTATLVSVTFAQNVARWKRGGAMFVANGSPSLSGCHFLENSALSHGNPEDPDLVGSGGGLFCWGVSSPSLDQCVFSNNAGVSGGGLRCNGASPSLTYCTFSNNRAEESGGGIRCDGYSSAVFANCTMYSNHAVDGGGAYVEGASHAAFSNTIISFSSEGGAIRCDELSSVTLTCCDICGNQGGDWWDCAGDQYGINGNISEDPLLCDPANGDFHLQCGSPCAPFTSPNPECDLIGAWPVGCGGTAVEGTSWSSLKALYR